MNLTNREIIEKRLCIIGGLLLIVFISLVMSFYIFQRFIVLLGIILLISILLILFLEEALNILNMKTMARLLP